MPHHSSVVMAQVLGSEKSKSVAMEPRKAAGMLAASLIMSWHWTESNAVRVLSKSDTMASSRRAAAARNLAIFDRVSGPT